MIFNKNKQKTKKVKKRLEIENKKSNMMTTCERGDSREDV